MESELLSCGHMSTPGTLAAGYARMPEDDRKICYACADEYQRKEVQTAAKVYAYVSSNGMTIQTWTGGSLMRVLNMYRRGMPRHTYSVWARDPHGQLWYGIGGGAGMYVGLRRSNAK